MRKTERYHAHPPTTSPVISPYNLTRNLREFLPKERVRKVGRGCMHQASAPDSNYEKGILIMNEATTTNNERISITMTDLQSMIEAAARQAADEAVKA